MTLKPWTVTGLCLAAFACVEAVPPSNQDITQIGPDSPTTPTDANQSLSPFGAKINITPDPNDPLVHGGITLSPLLATGRCLDVPKGETTNGVPVGLWDCNDFADAQRWTWSNGTLRIQGGKKCLVVGSPDILQATTVVLTDCSAVSAAPQQGVWNYLNGLVQAGSANRCLQTGDASAQRGVPLTLAPCSSSDPRQRWGLDQHNGTYLRGGIVTMSTNNTKCLDVYNGSDADGTTVAIYDCNYGPPQQWVMEGLTIRAVGKCLTVSSSTPNFLEIRACDGSAAQQWVLNAGQIQRADKIYCLELPNDDSTNLARVRVAPCTGAPQQQWVWGGSG